LYFAKFLCPRKGKPAEAPYLKKDGSNPGFTNPILGSKGASEAGESGDGRCELLLSVSAFTDLAIFMGKVINGHFRILDWRYLAYIRPM
jgi:hypothetical protein